MSADEFHDTRLEDVRTRTTKTLLVMRYDGRMVQVVSRFLPDGGWVTVHEDVTERLQYEEMLRHQNFMLDAALENMAHGLAFYDSEMRLRVCNTTYRKIYRLSPEEAKPGTHLGELIERSMANGAFSSEYSPRHLLEAASARIADRNSSPIRRRMSNGTTISVRLRPGRGWFCGHLRGHHRARARSRGAERAVSALRRGPEQHEPGLVHARFELARHRLQSALYRDVRTISRIGEAGCVDARDHGTQLRT